MLVRANSGSGGSGGTLVDLTNIECLGSGSGSIIRYTIGDVKDKTFAIVSLTPNTDIQKGTFVDITNTSSWANIYLRLLVYIDSSGVAYMTNKTNQVSYDGNVLTYTGGNSSYYFSLFALN